MLANSEHRHPAMARMVVAAIADRGPASTTPATVSAVRIERLRSVSFRDSIPSPPRRLPEGTGQTPEWTCRSCSYVTALQSRRSLRKIFRPARSRIVSAMVSKMGCAGSKNSKIEWFIFSEHRVCAIQSDAAQ